jgi:hypothetical protein
MQVELPAPLLQDRDLPAAPGPGATLTDEMSAVEKPSVNSADTGGLPVAFSEMSSATVLPGAAAPDERLSEVCAVQQRQTAKIKIEVRTIRSRSAW